MCPSQEEKPAKIYRMRLSVICENSTEKITERVHNRLLRPIFINAVEVGFAYAKGSNAIKKLTARGVTISLWYFISRGHQAQALLPFCFKSYPDKSNQWDELMALYNMNLVEFTPGFGSDKYIEVNRIMATRAREYGGCIVARSQMHTIVEREPMLDRVVEQKLLMPSFNGTDIIFPIDGPLGRNGCTFAETIVCKMDDPEWSRCVLQQMTSRDQQIWMTSLANLTQNPEWMATAERVSRYMSCNYISIPPGFPKLEEPSFQIHPPDTNPPENRGFSKFRYRPRRNRFLDDDGSNGYHHRSVYNNSNMEFSNSSLGLSSKQSSCDTSNYFEPSYRRNSSQNDEKKSAQIGHSNSVYRLNSPSRSSAEGDFKDDGPSSESKSEAPNNRSRRIFRYSKMRPMRNRPLQTTDSPSKLFDVWEENNEEKKQKTKCENDSMKCEDEGNGQEQEKEEGKKEEEDNKTEDEKDPEQEHHQDEKEEKEQDEEADVEEEKETKELPEGNSAASGGEIKKHLTCGKKGVTGVAGDTGGGRELLALTENETVICSESGDADVVAVAKAYGDDLISFSDSETED